MTRMDRGLMSPISDSVNRVAGCLPTWPFTLTFIGFPVWWVLGVVDFIWIPMAGVMALYLISSRSAVAPKGFGVWLLFLLWAACSVIGLTHPEQLMVFGYRLSIYTSCAVLFLYVYNNRRMLTDRFVTGVLTIWWLIIVVAGYLALLFPTGVFRTPLSFIVPQSFLANPWLNQMLIRRLNQYNPDSYWALDPRPAAPFLYSNNWGQVYSILLPLVVVYLWHVRGSRRFWLILPLIPVSFVPAALTTNRGMFLGLAVAGIYLAFRMLLRRGFRGVLVLGAVALVGITIFNLLPTAERLETRGNAPSISDRASLYVQAIQAVQDSPLFGYGRTIGGVGTVDPVGTQGQIWMVLVSHGLGAAILFLAWFLLAFILSIRRTDPCGLAANTVILVATLELGFYGILPYGLPLIMIAMALALRGPESDDVVGRGDVGEGGGIPESGLRGRSLLVSASSPRGGNEEGSLANPQAKFRD